MSVRIDLKMKLVNVEEKTRKFKKHIPMAFVERVKRGFPWWWKGYHCTPNSLNKEFGYFWLSTINLKSHISIKPGEERPGGSCSWILVTLNAEKELMKQLTNFKSSEAMWRSSVKLGGVEVQSPKTHDEITTNENGDHDYVEYNNSSTTSPCQDHSPWLSA
ncbi:hypothetical protein F2Q69_00017722 [Brassica cretica]|uniref:Uncharacterized protein n=1 Tax=Brassica cretica TaxID=69181 RepID=A0A8S9R9V8_BRACR|nr:hypothetical protein F2Q69_00017722 [Brassica cretica]